MADHDIDDILSQLGIDPEQDSTKPNIIPAPPGHQHTIDTADQAFSPLPATPAHQKDTRKSVDTDPAVKEKPAAERGPSIGKSLNDLYTPDTPGATDLATPSQLGPMLIGRGAISKEQLSTAQNVVKQSPGNSLARVLVEQGGDEVEIQRGVAEIAGVPFERIDLTNGAEGAFDGALFQRLGSEFCKNKGVLPLRKEGARVVLGATNANDVFLVDEAKRLLHVTSVKLVLITAIDLKGALELVGETAAEEVDISELLSDVEESDVEVEQNMSGEAVDLEAAAGESPVIRYVNYIIQTAVKEGASDIHVEPAEKKLKVRFRIDGVLFEMMNPPGSMSSAITSRLKIMANLDISERRVPQDGRIRCTVQGRKLDLRVSTLPTPYGEKTVMRILDTKSINVELADLGFETETYEIWSNQIKSPHGIIMVTGPTGSGKTTTLYSSLRVLDKQKLNISTVEDPVEYHLDGITQTQTHEKIGMTFSKALRALLRQDPDVIMVGEIRDLDTAHTAVQAALTGHLVLSTLHTNDAPSSITRLVNIGLEPFLVGAAINAVLAQRLVRRLCKHCKAEEKPSNELMEYLELNGFPTDVQWVSKGCERCRNTGFQGRVGIYELLSIDDQVRDIIARNPNVSEFRRLCMERGMVGLQQDGLKKVAAGVTTFQEILRVTREGH